jgi:hypothetical protein
MPFSTLDDKTQALLAQVLDGAMLVLEITRSEAIAPDRRPETIARMTSRVVAAVAEGHRDFETLQARALDGIA